MLTNGSDGQITMAASLACCKAVRTSSVGCARSTPANGNPVTATSQRLRDKIFLKGHRSFGRLHRWYGRAHRS